MSQFANLIGQVKNPLSGQSLESENRVQEVKVDGDEITVIYNRNDIDTKSKRELENQIYEVLLSDFSEDNIFVKSVSDADAPKVKPVQSKPKVESQAELKVGHGTIAPKKRIPNVKKVIAVSSCKGGVGKSTVTVNLASALAKKGLKIGVVDADIYGPSIPRLLGQKDAKPAGTPEKKIKPIEAHGLKFMSFGLFIPDGDPVIWRGPMLGGVLNQFFFDTAWEELDFLLIDLPPGTGDIQLSMIQAAEVDGALIVSTPQQVAIDDTRKGLNMFNQLKVEVLGLVENMSYFSPDGRDEKYYIFGEGGVKKMAKELDVPFLQEIPLEMELRESSDNGIPYMSQNNFEGRVVWDAYSNLANQLAELVGEKSAKKPGFFSKIFS